MDASQELGNESTFREGGLPCVMRKKRGALSWTSELSGVWAMEAGGAIEAACGHSSEQFSVGSEFAESASSLGCVPWVLNPRIGRPVVKS